MTTTLEIINRLIAELRHAEYNPREATKQQREAVRESLERFGFIDPVIVNKHPDRMDVIVGGHRRSIEWEALGHDSVPTVEVHLDLDEERELNIRLNKNTGDWDYQLLEANFDKSELQDWGWDKDELKFWDNASAIEEDEGPPAPKKKSLTRPGDIYEIGDHRIMCGDATDKKHFLRLMGDLKARMCFTDPPYGVSYVGPKIETGKQWEMLTGDDLRGADLERFLWDAFMNVFTHTGENPALYCFYASANHMQFEQALLAAGFKIKQQLIWNKGHIMGHSDYHWVHEPILYCIKEGKNCEWYGNRKQKTVQQLLELNPPSMTKEELVEWMTVVQETGDLWTIRKDPAIKYQHPTQKPIMLAARAMMNSSEEGDIVLDPFMGSGSTLMAAEQGQRRCYGMELAPRYCDVIVKRWVKWRLDRNKDAQITLNGKELSPAKQAKYEPEIVEA